MEKNDDKKPVKPAGVPNTAPMEMRVTRDKGTFDFAEAQKETTSSQSNKAKDNKK